MNALIGGSGCENRDYRTHYHRGKASSAAPRPPKPLIIDHKDLTRINSLYANGIVRVGFETEQREHGAVRMYFFRRFQRPTVDRHPGGLGIRPLVHLTTKDTEKLPSLARCCNQKIHYLLHQSGLQALHR